MSNKEWYEEIPRNGVLCKNQHGLMINAVEVVHGVAFNAEENGLSVRDLTPVTVQEWWDFAPWQPIEDAPVIDAEYLLLFSDGTILVRDRKFSFSKKVNGEFQEFYPIKFMALPKVNHE